MKCASSEAPGAAGGCDFRPMWPGLRPTPDRVRETLFNWLRDEVTDRRCLDLYAGSGALGFEALSRGAREVVFVDRDPRVARSLAESLTRFGSRAGKVHRADAQAFLREPGEPFDLVFLDPPFDAGVLPRSRGADRRARLDAAGRAGVPRGARGRGRTSAAAGLDAAPEQACR